MLMFMSPFIVVLPGSGQVPTREGGGRGEGGGGWRCSERSKDKNTVR